MADQADHFARFNVQAEVLEHRLVRFVAERHVLDANVTADSTKCGRARMLNQISIWLSQELCLGVYTKRMRWLGSERKAARVLMLVR